VWVRRHLLIDLINCWTRLTVRRVAEAIHRIKKPQFLEKTAPASPRGGTGTAVFHYTKEEGAHWPAPDPESYALTGSA